MEWPGKYKDIEKNKLDFLDGDWNRAIDACRAALEEACDRDALANIIPVNYTAETGYVQIIPDEHTFAIADAIRKHLNLVTSAETGKESNVKADKV